MMTSSSRQRQTGAALLMLMLLVIVATTTVLLSNVNRANPGARQIASTAQALAIARDALIEYAAINPDMNPGQGIGLPCPDMEGGLSEGLADEANCGAAGETVLGRFPWRTLGTEVLRDGAHACLWYVVSGSYKHAGAVTAGMINPDTNGQLQRVNLDTGDVVGGLLPEDRPVAMIIAPMQPLPGQGRSGAGEQCSSSYAASDFLDNDTASGLSNATTSAVPDAIDAYGDYSAMRPGHNDRIVVLTRADIENRVRRRPDFDSRMRSLGTAVTACIASYAASNPGGNNDLRLPWPAPLQLAEYRDDAAYDDADAGTFSGRLPDVVDDSNAATGNALGRVLADCDPAEVPEWSATKLSEWSNWKDHFFYAVAESFAPNASVPSKCGSCLSVNGAGKYAALVIFANSRLVALGQVRNSPPTDADTKSDVANYLEDLNAGNLPSAAASMDFSSQPASNTFNDLLFCIDKNMNVSEC